MLKDYLIFLVCLLVAGFVGSRIGIGYQKEEWKDRVAMPENNILHNQEVPSKCAPKIKFMRGDTVCYKQICERAMPTTRSVEIELCDNWL